jgi:uncharacterized membrane protein
VPRLVTIRCICSRIRAAGPDPGGRGFALLAVLRLLDHRLQASRQLAHHLQPLGVSLGFLPGLALCLLAVAGAAHDTSHDLVAPTLPIRSGEASANQAARRSERGRT